MDPEFEQIIRSGKFYCVFPGNTPGSAVKLICCNAQSNNTMSLGDAIDSIKHSKSTKVKVARPNVFSGKYQSKKEVLALLQKIQEGVQ